MRETKKVMLSIIMSFFMIFSTAAAPAMTAQAETQVLVTRTGSKYHNHKCGNGTYYYDSLSSALARGLTPCSKCYGGSSSTQASSNEPSHQQSAAKTKKISLSKTSLTLVKGASKKLTVKNASGSVKWTTSDTSVASVSGGVIKAKAKGKAVITASANGQSKSCKVKVEEPKISKTALSLEVDDEAQLKIAGCSHDVVWKTSDEDVVDVDDDGYVSAAAPGTAVITGKVHGRKYTCKVTVAIPQITELEIVNPVLTMGTDDYCTLELETDNDEIFMYEDVVVTVSDESVAAVDDINRNEISIETYANTGTVTVTVSIGGLEDECMIIVE